MPHITTASSDPARCWASLPRLALAAGIGLAMILLPPLGVPASRAQDAGNLVQMPSLAPIIKKVMPAVVNISVQETAAQDESSDDDDGNGANPNAFPNVPPGSPMDQFLRKFFEDQGMAPPDGRSAPRPRVLHTALGSGFIVDPSGYVVTNNHVIDGAQKVTVIFQDDSKHPAKVIGRDAKTDLALLKISADKPLAYVSWGDSSAEQVGDWVIAVGNPFGLGGTVSAGIVSARSRDIHSGPYDDYLQIDAPINRGNSGGPTFNLKGEVIGINTAIYSPNGGSVGIGFAIPANLAKPVIAQLREHGKVSRGWLGVQIQQVTPAIAKNMGLPNDRGALVADVTKDGPAAKAGFQQGDVILAFNGRDVAKMRELPVVVAETPTGTAVKVTVWRKGSVTTLNATIAEQPENLNVASADTPETPDGPERAQRANALGLKLTALTPELRKALQVPEHVKGVAVQAIGDSSPLSEVDLQPGDVIVSINQQPVTTPKDAAAKLKAGAAGPEKSLLLQINRHGSNAFVAWSADSDDG